MKDNERKILTLLLYILIGLIISPILGIIESQLLLDKPTLYRESMLWKYTILFYFLTGVYTVWFYFFRNYLPVLISSLKFVGVNFILSVPCFGVLIITKTVSIDVVLMFLPADIVLLAGGFIWFVALKIDPEAGEYSTKIIMKYLPVIIVIIAVAVFNDVPRTIVLFLAAIAMLGQSLLLLRQAKKKTFNSSQKAIDK